jgi:protein-S-isoprenylcysteine O-methyltransferase Ste14
MECNKMLDFDTLINWIFAVTSIGLLTMIIVGWLLSFRGQKSPPVGRGKWIFELPAWVQITTGFATTILLVYFGYLLWIPLPISLPTDVKMILSIVGLVIFLVGTFLVLWARWTLGAMYGVSTSSAVQLKSQHFLIQHGPYAYIRHPMYLGCWLTLGGVTLTSRTLSPLLLLLICLPGFYLRARREELVLEIEFGKEWKIYTARVPMFVPL